MSEGTSKTLHYKALKNFATKTAKVKQTQLLNAAALNEINGSSSAKFAEELYTKVSGGVCISLVAFWLSEKLAGRSPHARESGVPAASQVENLRIVRNAVGDQDLYKRLIKDGLEYDARDALFLKYGLGIDPTWENRRYDTPGFGWFQLLNATAVPSAYHIRCELDAGTKRGAHAVALYHPSDGTRCFFDPNVGEYSIDGKENAKEFFRKWKLLSELEMQSVMDAMVTTRVFRTT